MCPRHLQQRQKDVAGLRRDLVIFAVVQTLQSESSSLLSGGDALWAQNKTASPNMQLWLKDPLAVCCLPFFTPPESESLRVITGIILRTTEGTMTASCCEGVWQRTALSCVQDDCNSFFPFHFSLFFTRVCFYEGHHQHYWHHDGVCNFFTLSSLKEFWR